MSICLDTYRSDRDAEKTLAEDEDESDSTSSGGDWFSFPELDDRIRRAIKEYGAVFPKLNFSSPRVSLSLESRVMKLSYLGCRMGTPPLLTTQVHIPRRRVPCIEIIRFRYARHQR